MPRVNPNADDNDPLWPKAFQWPGGRALAPLRKPAPPMPPGLQEEPPNEKFPWIVDPDNRPAAPPKGDENTGQKIGPAFTKLPRDAQRGAVNSTFDSMVSDARAMKGSVFDTGFDKALRFGASDPHGGLGVVSNPSNAVFRDLERRVPRFAGSLQKMRPITEYVAKKADDFKRNVLGVTTGIDPEKLEALGRFAQTGRTLPGPVKRTAPELERLYSINAQRQGSTLQSIRPTLQGSEAEVTPIHEGFHALYANKFPKSQVPEMADARARELLTRVLERSGVNPVNQAGILSQYYRDPQHGLVEALAQFVNQKAKHGMGVR